MGERLEKGAAEAIARDLVAAHRARRPFASLKHRMPLAADCHDVQHAYVTMLGGADRVAGYKIGLPTARMQAACRVHEPTAGTVFAGRVQRSGARVSAGAYVRLGIDLELCVILDRDLDAGCTRADVARSLRSVCAAFELIDDRGADVSRIDGPSLIADNSWNEGVVLGDPATPERDLAVVPGRLKLHGAEIQKGSSADALGDPLEGVVWLAGHLARRGERLGAGQLVMTGSIVPSRFPKPGELYQFDIDGLPPVVLEVTE